jgi:hypothetical protein
MRKIKREFWFAVADVFFFTGFAGSKPYRWAMGKAMERSRLR